MNQLTWGKVESFNGCNVEAFNANNNPHLVLYPQRHQNKHTYPNTKRADSFGIYCIQRGRKDRENCQGFRCARLKQQGYEYQQTKKYYIPMDERINWDSAYWLKSNNSDIHEIINSFLHRGSRICVPLKSLHLKFSPRDSQFPLDSGMLPKKRS